MTYQAARAVSIPVIGMGGIMSGADALEFMVAGARAVQVGTANFVEPGAAVRIVGEMGAWCDAHGVARVTDLVATLKT
jgi:dihydroorotate dehydrogenase (NAD+) catalytic subunit